MPKHPRWQDWPWQFVAAGPGDSPRVGEVCEHAGFWYVLLSGAHRPDGTPRPPERKGPYSGRAVAEQVAAGWVAIYDAAPPPASESVP